MIWSSASDFWHMGGYGVFVWGSMGVSAALLLLEVWLSRRGRQQALCVVCEALDAEALDVGQLDALQASPIGESPPPFFSQGATT